MPPIETPSRTPRPHQGARRAAAARQHLDRHAVLLRQLDRPAVQHPGAEAGQLQHLAAAHLAELARPGHLVGIGRVNAVYIGIDAADRRPQRRRQCHRRGIRPAAAERRHLAATAHPLKAGHHNGHAPAELLLDGAGINRANARVTVLLRRADAGSAAAQCHRRYPQRAHRHSHQRGAGQLAGGQQQVGLPFRRVIGDLLHAGDEPVGRAALRRHDSRHPIAPTRDIGNDTGCPQQLAAVGQRAAAKFDNNSLHGTPSLRSYPFSGLLHFTRRRVGVSPFLYLSCFQGFQDAKGRHFARLRRLPQKTRRGDRRLPDIFAARLQSAEAKGSQPQPSAAEKPVANG